MTLAAGSRLGPYEILAPLGAGGMGEFYRAKDKKGGRIIEMSGRVIPEGTHRKR
ncbi:MAG TPA: hypothetical protein VGK70_12775 [Thermoanaerobaculia bacterium]